MHQNLTGYDVLSVTLGKKGENYDLFVGLLGEKLHVLGDRPQNLSYLFPERERIGGDYGVLKLPQNRHSLSDLLEGDVLKIVDEKGKLTGLKKVIYQGKR